MKLARFLIPCLVAFACTSSYARADNGGLGLAYLFGYGGFNQCGMRSYVPAPPYFALHPPVYYGQRYTRPYGASPFAAWPQLQSNSSYAPAPHVDRAQTIANPYAPGVVMPASSPGIVQSNVAEPVVIDNPYFQPATQYTSKKFSDK